MHTHPDTTKLQGINGGNAGALHIFTSTSIPSELDGIRNRVDKQFVKDGSVSYYRRFLLQLHHTFGRCFFISKNGFIELCPYGTREGDRLVALQGARLASVLRAQKSITVEHSMGGSCWAFLGEAFVHAWMDGRYVQERLGSKREMDELYVLI